MEAKVDVRKLQLLNDRIAQTIEALNQVRLSVHGLSHASIPPSSLPFTPSNIPFTPTNVPFPGYMAMPPTIPGYPTPYPILQHTPFTPPVNVPFVSPINTPFVPTYPGFTPPFLSGLSHTPEYDKLIELKATDPIRLIQTFPFMNTPYWSTW
jgi:hypothetical protein